MVQLASCWNYHFFLGFDPRKVCRKIIVLSFGAIWDLMKTTESSVLIPCPMLADYQENGARQQ
jgi:hypothetical protein